MFAALQRDDETESVQFLAPRVQLKSQVRSCEVGGDNLCRACDRVCLDGVSLTAATRVEIELKGHQPGLISVMTSSMTASAMSVCAFD